MKPRHLYILFHGRFPSEKAAALFAQKSAESFARYASVTLMVPRRLFRGKPQPLPTGVRVVYLPTIDLFHVPFLSRIAFFVSYAAFSLSCLAYLFVKLAPEDIVDTNESLPALAVSLLTRNIIFEVHDFPERFHSFYALLFKRMRYVLATNVWKKEELMRRFQLSEEKIFLERNGVDTDQFVPRERDVARTRLGIPLDRSVVVYTGHLYAWKGVETLAKAAALLPETDFYFVGGAEPSVKEFSQTFSAPNIHAVGQRPHEEIPLWQSSADVLVLPNTGKEEISAHYTSPMKLFEYMASGRPIVASAIPSVREILNEENAYLVEPDNAHALAHAVTHVLGHADEAHTRALSARAAADQFSWEKRAARLHTKIKELVPVRENFRFTAIVFAYAVLLGAVLYPFIYQEMVFIGGDITVYYYGAFDFYHKALVSGQSFLWNPLLFSGFPMYLSQVAGYFDPLNYLIFSFLGGFDGVHLRLYIDYLLVLVASYLAGRVWGLSRIASFCIGPAYMLSLIGTIITNPLFANSAFLMPFLVWIFGQVRTRGGFTWKLALSGAIAVGWAFLAGYAQVVIMYLTLFGLLGLLYVVLVLEKERLLFFLRFAALCAGIAFGGFVIGLPQILPALDFVPLTRRGGGVDYTLASLKAVLPGDILLFIFPDYLYFPYVSVGRKCLYVGASWFLLAAGFLSVVGRSVWQNKREMREPLIFALVFVVAFVTAFTHSPIFYALQHVPIFDLFRFSDRWMYGGVFFLAMLGGYGLDALSHACNTLLIRVYAFITGTIALFLGFIVFLNAATVSVRHALADAFIWIFSHTVYGYGPYTKDILHYKEAAVRGIAAWQQFTAFSDISFLVPVLLLLASIGLLWAFLLKKLSIEAFRVCVLGTVVIAFVIVSSFPLADRLSQDDIAALHERSFMQFVSSEDAGQYRYYPVFLADGFQNIVPPTYRLSRAQISGNVQMAFSTGWPNTNFQYGMPSVDGYDVFVSNTYIDTLALAGSTFGAQDYTRAVPLEEKIERLYEALGVVGMMGGKYIVSGVPLKHTKLTLLGTYTTSDLEVPTYVYENIPALPLVYFARDVVEARGETLPELVAESSTDFIEHTYVDCSSCDREVEVGTILSQKFANGAATITLASEGDTFLIYSQSLLPGWRASLDGMPVEIVRTNGLYMGVFVPAGAHTVEFVYHGQLNRGI